MLIYYFINIKMQEQRLANEKELQESNINWSQVIGKRIYNTKNTKHTSSHFSKQPSLQNSPFDTPKIPLHREKSEIEKLKNKLKKFKQQKSYDNHMLKKKKEKKLHEISMLKKEQFQIKAEIWKYRNEVLALKGSIDEENMNTEILMQQLNHHLGSISQGEVS